MDCDKSHDSGPRLGGLSWTWPTAGDGVAAREPRSRTPRRTRRRHGGAEPRRSGTRSGGAIGNQIRYQSRCLAPPALRRHRDPAVARSCRAAAVGAPTGLVQQPAAVVLVTATTIDDRSVRPMTFRPIASPARVAAGGAACRLRPRRFPAILAAALAPLQGTWTARSPSLMAAPAAS